MIPPVNSIGLSPAIPDLLAYVRPKVADVVAGKKKAGLPRSRCVVHSVPKRKHLRRSFSIPNPLNQCALSDEIVNDWTFLRTFCEQSPISLSIPRASTRRAIEAENDLGRQPFYRTRRSVGARYLLKTDIARYYPSIYTHSIPWAIHTKPIARADTKLKLYGNRLDLWLRETQDRQTGGIPIGPDSSFLVGEVMGTALDLELQSRLGQLRGIRYIDDFYLYFPTISEAERGLSCFHEVSKSFEMEINDPKTEIIQLPERLEPVWKSDLRSLRIRDSGQAQATDLLTLFDRAFEHAKNFQADSVLTYAARQVLSSDITSDNWQFCESLLLKAALGEPSLFPVLVDLYDKFGTYQTDNAALTAAIESICTYHAPLQQGNEVAWALWLAKKMDVSISKEVGAQIANVDDDVVALIALDLREQGFLDLPGVPLWSSYLSASNLYDNHWLLAYEAHEQGWLPSVSLDDYISKDEFYSILRTHGVRFYGAGLTPAKALFAYDEDESDSIQEGESDDPEMSFPEE